MMRKIAIDKAAHIVNAATDALTRAQTATGYDQFSRFWSEFLTAYTRFYNALDAGKVVSPRSEKWVKQKKAERKDNSLLQYLFQARNADEHGLEPVVIRQAPSLTVGHGNNIYIENLVVRHGEIINLKGTEDGKPITVRHHPEGARLVSVTNRGISYTPPEEFARLRRFDEIASEVFPVISYMKGLVDEGRSYIID